MSCWASSFLSNACNNPQTSQTEMDHQWLYSLELTEWKMEHTKQSLPIRIKWSKWPRECLQHLLSSGKRRNVFIDHIEWCKCARNTSKWDYIKATSAKNQFDALVFLEDGFKGDSKHTRQHVHLSQPILSNFLLEKSLKRFFFFERINGSNVVFYSSSNENWFVW